MDCRVILEVMQEEILKNAVTNKRRFVCPMFKGFRALIFTVLNNINTGPTPPPTYKKTLLLAMVKKVTIPVTRKSVWQ